MQTVDANLAFADIVAPAARGDGWRHLFLGNSGKGKTVANRALIQYALSHGAAHICLTLDDKSNWYAQYQGTYRINPADLRKRMPDGIREKADHIVYRGVALSRNPSPEFSCSPEDVARHGWELVRAKPGFVLVNIDELADATNGGQAWKRERGEESPIEQLYRKGRGCGLSITATTQLPQSLPRAAFGLSETIGIFQLTAREVAYLTDYKIIAPDVAEVILRLEVGNWILYDKSKGEWNGQIYRVNAPA